MSFLDNIWKQLSQKQKNQQINEEKSFKDIYKGYRTIPIQQLQRRSPNFQSSNAKGEDLWKQNEKTEIFTYMENEKFTNHASNGFFQCFYKAYMEHGDIKIKPDEVWMIIMLFFAKYADDNAQQLRHAFVMHQGKKELVVQTDKNLYDWIPFMNGVIDKIKQNTVKGVVEQLECNFTSTGLFERIFSTALVMNTCKKYFDYTREGGSCGVVNIHMAGTLEDWEKLEKKLVNLQHFDVNGQLKKYVRGLKPVLHQFTETFKGNAHLQFWNNLYFQREEPDEFQYMPVSTINGWLINFFTTSEQITEIEQLQNFSVDIKYIDKDTRKITYFNLNGGCKGYSCIDQYVYTPHYSIAIVQDCKKMKNVAHEVKITESLNKHKERMMKKKQQSIPITNKKIINIGFNNEKPPTILDPFTKKERVIMPNKIDKKEVIQPLLPIKIVKISTDSKEEKLDQKKQEVKVKTKK